MGKYNPRRQQPVKVNARKLLGETRPGQTELNNYLQCLRRNMWEDSSCASELNALNSCMKEAAALKKRGLSSVNFHLQRLQTLMRRGGRLLGL